MSEDRDETEALLRMQAERAEREAALAAEAPVEEERLVHERRAEKAAYLREQLDRREDVDGRG